MPRSPSPPPPDRRGLRRIFLSLRAADRDPLLSNRRSGGIASAALRGLGCVSSASAEARAPTTAPPPSSAAAAAVRTSADWQGRGRRRTRRKRDAPVAAASGGIGDFWCAPGIPLAAAETSVDCVVTARHQIAERTRGEHDRVYRHALQLPRMSTMQEEISLPFADSPPHHQEHFFDASILPSGRLRHLPRHRHSTASAIEDEIMLFQTRILLGGMGIYDRYQDWRLDVDNMSYEELLELGDKIGYVNTGLGEDEVLRRLERVRYAAVDSARYFSAEAERKCSICQEEYEAGEETGRLGCGHSYHVCCIKKWLSVKNACPVCKTAVSVET